MSTQPELSSQQNTQSQTARPTWRQYYLLIAKAVATRADCSRRKVGAVIVNDNRIRATGYNGSPSGGPSCLAGECPRGRSEVAPGSSYDTGAGSCIALHAEQNALLWADPGAIKGGVIFITDEPCQGCLRMLQGSGLSKAIWPNGDAWLGFQKEPNFQDEGPIDVG